MEYLQHTKHLHGRILYQLIIFLVVSVILFGFVGYDALQGTIQLEWVIGGVVIGLVVGWISGRMFTLKWHPDTQKVIMGMDRLGILLLVLYILFRYFGTQFLGHFLHGPTLTAFSFSLLGGIMVGRFISMIKSIQRILKEQKVI